MGLQNRNDVVKSVWNCSRVRIHLFEIPGGQKLISSRTSLTNASPVVTIWSHKKTRWSIALRSFSTTFELIGARLVDKCLRGLSAVDCPANVKGIDGIHPTSWSGGLQ
jgi:hypothetical protein